MRSVTGLLPHREETRRRYAAERPFSAGPVELSTVIQNIGFIRDQKSKPSCVGQSLAACIDAKLLTPPWASAVDLWVDARRRQGDLENELVGTRAEYGIESLINRGWSPRVDGEDARPAEMDKFMPDLLAELAGHDHRMRGVRHYSVTGNRKQNVISALHQGFGVVFGTGVRDPYFSAPESTILGTEYLGGDDNGHEQRVFAYFADLDAFGVQNSWSRSFGGFVYAGTPYPGCVLVTHEVIEQAWDVDVLEVLI